MDRWYREDKLAEGSGVSREEWKRARRTGLEPGTHWSTWKSRTVLTEEAVGLAAQFLGICAKTAATHRDDAPTVDLAYIMEFATESVPEGFPDCGKRPPRPPLPPPKAETVDLVFDRICQNRKIVMARHPEGALVRVRVRDNSNFVKGMVMACFHVDQDLYGLARKTPRHRGRW